MPGIDAGPADVTDGAARQRKRSQAQFTEPSNEWRVLRR